MDDELLIQRTLAGNRDAFRLLVLRYQRPLFRFLGLLGFRGARAEDIAQDRQPLGVRGLAALRHGARR